ncbi:hypothetical protein A3K92_06555 [Thermococcus gorgonarius]|uniref:Uncharacterized protein n=2 Tax=Thermococcus gorgonarius TaxID=71997 RepID=A0A2Z2M6D6_THEGO|nr:hypothetical protein A3K92_06555 [Thermococcus gorgonarius]
MIDVEGEQIGKQHPLFEYLPELQGILNNNSFPVLVFYRRVKSKTTEVSQRIVKDDTKQHALVNVLQKILSNAHEIKEMDTLDLTPNREFWIISLLDSYPNIDVTHAQFLLNDFTFSMTSRMREEEKYGILIISKDMVMLCHSKFGEVTITPDFEVLPRMLDSDNIIRFVAFIKKKNGKIHVKYHEDYKTKFLMEWLGVSKKELFSYMGGKYRFESEFGGIKIALEFTEEDVYKLITGRFKGISLKDGQLMFESPIDGVPINLIRIGKKPYSDFEEFKQDFLVEYFTVDKIVQKYKELLNSHYTTSGLYQAFDDLKEVTILSRKSGKTEKTIPKRIDNLIPIFATRNKVEIKENLLKNIGMKVLNGEHVRIFHVGDEFSSKPTIIKSLEIYNTLSISEALSEIISATNTSETGRSYIDKLLLYVALKLLVSENQDKKLSFFLDRLSEKILSYIQISETKKVLRKEDVIIEYKSREELDGKDKAIIDRVSKDLKSKLENGTVVVFYFGFDEKSRSFDPISMGRINDNRLRIWENGVKTKTKASKVYFHAIPKEDSRKGMVLMVAIK